MDIRSLGAHHILRFEVDGYAAAEPQMTFTLLMMEARLAVGALASLAAGAGAAAIATPISYVLWVLDSVLAAAFRPHPRSDPE